MKIIDHHLRYGKENEPWKPNFLTALLQLLFLPIFWILLLFITYLIVLLDLVSVGSMHITFTAVSKKIQMPDGSIRIPT